MGNILEMKRSTAHSGGGERVRWEAAVNLRRSCLPQKASALSLEFPGNRTLPDSFELLDEKKYVKTNAKSTIETSELGQNTEYLKYV